MATCDRLVESEWVRHPHQVLHGDGFVDLGVDQERGRYVFDRPQDTYFQVPVHPESRLYLWWLFRKKCASSWHSVLVFLQLPRSLPVFSLWFCSGIIGGKFGFFVIWTTG